MNLTARIGPQPDLETARLRLTPFDAGDAPGVFAYASNPNVSRYTTWTTHTAISAAESYIRWVQGREDVFCWAMRPRPSRMARGAIEFGLENPQQGSVHYVLDEDLWNRGLMTEAVEGVVTWAFRTVGDMERVATSAISENRGSCRVLEKCGFRFDGLVEEEWDKFDDPVELATYSLSRADHAARGRTSE